MCDVYVEICFRQKNIYKWPERIFHYDLVSKRPSIERKHWLSGKEKIQDATVRKKKGDGESLLRYERIHRYWFFGKNVHLETVLSIT